MFCIHNVLCTVGARGSGIGFLELVDALSLPVFKRPLGNASQNFI